MTRFPEFWWMRTQTGGYEYIYIANYAAEGFTHSEAFSLSRYTASGSSSRLYSKSGAKPLRSITITNFRTYASNIGMRLLDIWAWSKLQMLYLVEFADYDSQTILGKGNNSGAIIDSGGCDTLGMKSGCLENDVSHSVIYRGIEDIFGNGFQACDGVMAYKNPNSNPAYVCENPDSYSSSSLYTELSFTCPTTIGFIKTVGYDENYPSVQMPTAVGGSSSTYVPDYYQYNTKNYTYTAIVVGGSNSYSSNVSSEANMYCGLWSWYYDYSFSTEFDLICARLLLNQ